VERAPIPDATAIASQVLASLDNDDRKFVEDGDLRVLSPAGSVAELDERLQVIEEVVGHCRTAQHKLEREIEILRQQLQQVPASIVRLEQWSATAEARLTTLTDGGHPAAPAQCGAMPQILMGQVDAVVRQVSLSGETHQGQDMEQWRSVREVAGALSLRQSTVRRYIRQGKFPAVRLPGGRGVRLPWPAVLDSLDWATNVNSRAGTCGAAPDVLMEKA
jgi:excisionase family DNA binding protein